jgi:hypothetical protein
MKICVLQPDYSASTVDYRHYDPRRDLSGILSGHHVDHVFLDKRTTHRQLAACARDGYDIYINLCEGYLDWDVPSIDVIHALDRLDLPYTGPTAQLYDPSKLLMKYVAHTAGVRTPLHALVTRVDEVASAATAVPGPWFVKPAHAGDSLGVDGGALVHDTQALTAQVSRVLTDYPEVLIESYIDGREFTVLVVADADGLGGCSALVPVEYQFSDGATFKTYALKTSDLHPSSNVPVRDAALASELTDAACRVFSAFGGVGYARMDFRMDGSGTLFFLEANFTCSVFYADGYEGSADYILAYDGIGARGFAERIIAEGIARHRRKRARHALAGSAVAGFGIVARVPFAAGDVVYAGQERPLRVVTRRHVMSRWSLDMQQLFRQYAYPLSDEVYALWDTDPTQWAPQNHSCVPNTAFNGMDVVALRAIAIGEELTIDYARSMNGDSEPFACRCGAAACRGWITGTVGNSVSARERETRV